MKAGDESMVIDGYTLRPQDAERRAWSYEPIAPSLERGAKGAPLLQLIEAGAIAFLQATARVALHEDARAALLRRLQEREPNARTLEAAPIAVERVALEVKTESGWTAIAQSPGLGTAPWTAALAATLDAAALAAVKAALAGERQRARLTARIVRRGSPATVRIAAARSETRIETPEGTSSTRVATVLDESSPASEPVALELDADIADFFSGGGTR